MSASDDFRDQDQPKKGMSTAVKVVLILAGLGGVAMIACCGGFYYIGQRFANSLSTDPVVVRAKTQEIVKIDILPGFEPKQSMDFIVIKFVLYQKSPDTGAALMLMEMNSTMTGGNSKDRREAFRQGMSQQRQQMPGGINLDAQLQEVTTKEYTINGQTAEFEFGSIPGAAGGGGETRQVRGVFANKGGTVMLLLSIPDSEYDEAAVVKMLESIQNP